MSRPDADFFRQAACRGQSIDLFFPEIPTGASQAVMDRQYFLARAFCKLCPVRDECLAYCLPFEKETGRRDGMYGGLTPQERQRMIRRR